MAREESDREDLMREATALVERMELRLPGLPDTVIVGRKRNGEVSVYFGPAPVYHFTTEGELRRAHADGFLYRSQGHTLARLTRQRTSETSVLLRHDLTAAELDTFLNSMQPWLTCLTDALAGGQAEIVQQIPAGEFPREELVSFLQELAAHPPRLAPATPGKR